MRDFQINLLVSTVLLYTRNANYKFHEIWCKKNDNRAGKRYVLKRIRTVNEPRRARESRVDRAEDWHSGTTELLEKCANLFAASIAIDTHARRGKTTIE